LAHRARRVGQAALRIPIGITGLALSSIAALCSTGDT